MASDSVNVNVKTVSSVTEFLAWLTKLREKHKDFLFFIFRGQANAEWGLESSAFRRLQNSSKNKTDLVSEKTHGDYISGLLVKAKERRYDIAEDGSKLEDFREVLARLQHYGAATNLIDFTKDALVALYMACQVDTDKKGNKGKVFALGRNLDVNSQDLPGSLPKVEFWENNFLSKKVLYWNPPQIENRIIAQSSVFIYGVMKIEDCDCEGVVEIDADSKAKILNELYLFFNKNYESLFPDLGGFAMSNTHNKQYSFVEDRKDKSVDIVDPVSISKAESYNASGMEKGEQGLYEDALSYFKKVIELLPDNPAGYCNAANIETLLGRYEQAIDYYSSARELSPNDASIYIDRGHVKCRLATIAGYNAAIEDYTEAIKLQPNNPVPYYCRAYVKGKECLGEPENAIVDYNKAIELKRDYTEAYNNRGVEKGNIGDYEEAIKDYDMAIELKQDYAEAYLNRGVAKDNLKRYAEAIKDFDMAIMLKSDFPEAYCNRSNSKRERELYQGAIEDCNKAIELKPDYAGAYYNRGLAKCKFNQKREYEEALKDFSEAIELAPGFAIAYICRGNAKKALGLEKEAEADFAKAKELEEQQEKGK